MERTTRTVRSRSKYKKGEGTARRTAVPEKKAGSNFIIQGSILAIAGIIVRLIGMLYRIPLANYIGDEGNGYYSAAYNIYSIMLILSSYSLPVAVSKMVSARLARGQYRNARKILRAALFYATIVGGVGFCALWFGSVFFAEHVIKMPYSAYALKVLAPTVWVMAYLGVLRGFFQGHSTMVPTAVSQIFEQIVNAVISLLAAKSLFDLGVKSNLVYGSTEYSYAFGAAGGALGTGAGALTALILFVGLYLMYRPKMKRRIRKEQGTSAESYGMITSTLFLTVVPIIVSSSLYNSSTVIDNVLFGQIMTGLGEAKQIASQWGIYSGKYHLLFNIPVAVANSLSSSLIPALSRAVAEKDRKQTLNRIASAIRFSMIIAIPSAVGLAVLAAPISNLLFPGRDNTDLIKMTCYGSSAVVVYSLSTVTNAVLQGINRMKTPIRNAGISLVLHTVILFVMLRYLHMGIYGVLYANILFALFICILNARAIARFKRYRQEVKKTFLIPMVASAVMGAAAFGVYRAAYSIFGNLISTGISVLVAVAVYFVLLILLKGVDAQELRSMPGGTRLSGLARKLHLMR
ncbi:putative polysaccharide biosynthesis protein [Lachnospiraceae bacterium HCP1S3_A8]